MKTAVATLLTALLLAGCASKGSKSATFTAVPTAGAPSNYAALGNPGAPAVTNVTGEIVKTPLTPEMLHPTSTPFTLGPGDVIEIEIIGSATPSRVLTPVGLDGKIYYNLLPGLDVWGLTLDQTRELLEKELAKYVTQPQVGLTLRVVGSKHVWVLGRLNHPGIFPLTGSMTLLESLALAGGTAHSASQITSQELADLRHSFVVRQGQFLPVDFHRLLRAGDMTQNIYLQPDDFVYVPSSLVNEVYVLGAVKFPRAVAYQEPMSLISAIAGSEGPERLQWISGVDNGPFMKDAYLSHVAIIRGSLAEPQIAVVDCNAIMKGRAPDVRLEPGDIIFIPNSPYTTIKRYVNLIVNTFVTTIAANEGIRAGGQNVGVNVAVPVNVTTPPTSGGTR
jgi:protein involved in polysaccharide export with SLBB domain